MKEDNVIYVLKLSPDGRQVLQPASHQIYPSEIARGRNVFMKYEPYTREVGCQYEVVKQNFCSCKNEVLLRRPEFDYFGFPKQIYTYHGPRNTDIGVGSVKALIRKRVKIYLPETDDRGVGSSDLTSFIMQKPRQPEPDSFYDHKKTSSKCVGGFEDPNAESVLSKNVSPINHTKSNSTSPILMNSNKNQENGSKAGVTAKTTTQAQHIDKKSIITTKSKDKKTLKLIDSSKKKSKLFANVKPDENNKEAAKDFSSDSLVQHIHNLEDLSEIRASRLSMEVMENKIETEYRHIFTTKSKEEAPKKEPPESDIKSASLLRRRFEALRRGLSKKEDTKRSPTGGSKESSQTSRPSHKDVSIASDPPSLEARSFSSNGVYSPVPPSSRVHDKKAYKRRANQKASVANTKNRNILQWGDVDENDSEIQGVEGMFELWGKKFDLQEEAQRNLRISGLPDSVSIKSIREPKQESPSLEDKKEGRKFFFFKKKTKEKNKPYKNKKNVTAGRCELRDGLMIKIGTSQEKQIAPKDIRRDVTPENYNKILRKAWFRRYLTKAIESKNSVKIRWNNKTYATSSSTVFELMDNVYKEAGVLLKSRSETTVTDSYYYDNHNRNHNVNFVHQDIETWMIPKTVTNNPKELPLKIRVRPSIEKRDNKNRRISDEKRPMSKPKALSRQIEVVLRSQNIVKLDKKDSSEYVTIDIPVGFFIDSSSENYKHKLSSEEEVYNIVEYETGSEQNRNLEYLKANNIEFTANVQTSNNAPLEKLKKVLKPECRDVIIQGSQVFILKKCDIVGVVTHTPRDIRNTKATGAKIRDEIVDSGPNEVFLSNNGIFGYADSYLLDYYKNSAPLGLELFPLCVSDSHVNCCLKTKSSINNQGDITRSCSDVLDVFKPLTSSCDTSCSHFVAYVDKDKNFEKGFNCNRKRNEVCGPRMSPKDSIQVCKQRMIYAASNKSKWNDYDATDLDHSNNNARKKANPCVKFAEGIVIPNRCCYNRQSCDSILATHNKHVKEVPGILVFKGKSPKCNTVAHPRAGTNQCEKPKMEYDARENGSPCCSPRQSISPTKIASPPRTPCCTSPTKCSSPKPLLIILPPIKNDPPLCPPPKRTRSPSPSTPSPCSLPKISQSPVNCPPPKPKCPPRPCSPPASPPKGNCPPRPCSPPPSPPKRKSSPPPCPPPKDKCPPRPCSPPASPPKGNCPPRPCSPPPSPPKRKSSPPPCPPPKGKCPPRPCSPPASPPKGNCPPRPCSPPPSPPKRKPSPPPCPPPKGKCPPRPCSPPPSPPKKKSSLPLCPAPKGKCPPRPCSPPPSPPKKKCSPPPSPPPKGKCPPRSPPASPPKKSCSPPPRPSPKGICSPCPCSPQGSPPPSKPPPRSRCSKICPPQPCPLSKKNSPSPCSCQSKQKSSSLKKTTSCCGPKNPSPPCEPPKKSTSQCPAFKKSNSVSPCASLPCICMSPPKKPSSPKPCGTPKSTTWSWLKMPCFFSKKSVCPPKKQCSKMTTSYAKSCPVPGIHIEVIPNDKKNSCKNNVPKCEQDDDCCIRLNSKEQLTIRMRTKSASTEAIREGFNIKVQDDDGKTLFERIDYSTSGKPCSPVVGSIYNSNMNIHNVHRVPTKALSESNKFNKSYKTEFDQDRSETNVANLIEIQFQMRVSHGDEATDVSIDNDVETNETVAKNDVYNIHIPDDVCVVKKEPLKNIENNDKKDDLSIRILIKTFKNKDKRDLSTEEYSRKISERLHTVSTGYNNNLCSNIDEKVFSVHRTTVDLSTSDDNCKAPITHVKNWEGRPSGILPSGIVESSNKIKTGFMDGDEKTSEIFDKMYTVKGNLDKNTSEMITSRLSQNHGTFDLDHDNKYIHNSLHSIQPRHIDNLQRIATNTNCKTEDSFVSGQDEITEKTDITGKDDYALRHNLTEKDDLTTERDLTEREDCTDKDYLTDNYLTEDSDVKHLNDRGWTMKDLEEVYHKVSKNKSFEQNYKDIISTDTDEQDLVLEANSSNEQETSTDMEVIIKPHTKKEKKEMLKDTFEKTHNLECDKTQIHKMLNNIFTSDSNAHEEAHVKSSELERDVTFASSNPKKFRHSDSMTNYYNIDGDSTSLMDSKIRSHCSMRSKGSVTSDEGTRKQCMCRTLTSKLEATKLVSGGGCCCSKRICLKDEETACDIKSSDSCDLTTRSQVDYVDVEIQHSKLKAHTSTDISVHSYTRSKINVVETCNVVQYKEVTANVIKTEIQRNRKSTKKNRIIHTSSMKVTHNNVIKVSDKTVMSAGNSPDGDFEGVASLIRASDILQSYEAKKAVLEIYAEETICNDGVHLIAKLPKFSYDRESEIEMNYNAIASNSYKSTYKTSGFKSIDR